MENVTDKTYLLVGVLILTNLGTIVTILFASFKAVYKFAVVETQTKALHRRVDRLEGKSGDDD